MKYLRQIMISSLAVACVAAAAAASAQDETAPAPTEETMPIGEVIPGDGADPSALPPPPPYDEGAIGEAPIAEVSQEAVHNPYGLSALWNEGDYVSKITLIILALMSIGSWQIFLTKVAAQSGLFAQGKIVQKKFWNADSVSTGVEQLSDKSAYRQVAEAGLAAANHHRVHLEDKIAQYDWVDDNTRREVETISARLQGGTAFLATVGSISPFVGLFGTVWGILHALIAIGVSGQASIDKVAGPVGEALIMTAIGLVVAVPAVAFYNIVIRRNRTIVDSLRHFSDSVVALIVSGNEGERAAAHKRKG